MASENSAFVTNLVAGVGALIITVILVLVVVSTMNNANLLGANNTPTITVTNETGGYINATGYQLGTSSATRSAYAISQAWNYSSDAVIPAGNYTVNTSTGIVRNATVTNWGNVNFTYSYTYTYPTGEQESVTGLIGNTTEGIGNISKKVPTILLIGAVVLLFGALVILISKFKQMDLSSQGSL